MERGTNNNKTMTQSDNNQYLVLSQSYDKGWKAYRIRNQESGIRKILTDNFPFLFGEEITDHVLVNNWENGWKIGNQKLVVSSQLNNEITTNYSLPTTIVIVYLPQYLEYLGFALLLLIPILTFIPGISMEKGRD